MNRTKKSLLALVLALFSGATFSVTGPTLLSAYLSGPNPIQGGEIGFDLWIETSDPFGSGGVTLAYNQGALTFVGFDLLAGGDASVVPPQSYNPADEDPSLCGLVLSGCIAPLQFGFSGSSANYQTEQPGGIKMGTFRFLHHGGASELILGEDPNAPLINYNSGGAFTDITLSGSAVVPLPLSAWLMVSGLTALFGLGCRKRRSVS